MTIYLHRAQPPLPLGGLSGDGVPIWNAELAQIDLLLQDERFLEILWRAATRNGCSARRGAPRMALNRVLRTVALKHIKNWSFRDLYGELQRNLDYRAFTQFFDEPIRSVAALSRNARWVDAQALREMNERLCELAREGTVVRGRRFRQDTTVCETNIHYPTDSTLMQDGNRVLQRLVARAAALAPELGRMRDRSRATRNRVIEIARAARGRGPQASERMQRSYCALMRITRSVLTQAQRVGKKLGEDGLTQGLGGAEQAQVQALGKELEEMLARAEQVLRQTRARIGRGITDFPDKLLSLFEPHSCAIRKGKAHKPTEFGRLVEIVEVENGFVADYRVHEGNPDDGSMFIPALERHIEHFGRAPRQVATDRGFFSAQNEKHAYALGVEQVSIPARGKLSALRRALQRQRWFRQLQRWRAGGEGRIGTLKNCYGLDRCLYKGDGAMERWVGWCVFANNLIVVARYRQRNTTKSDDAQDPSTKRQGHRAAA